MAEPFEPAYQTPSGALRILPFEIISAQFPIVFVAVQDVVSDRQNGVRHGYRGAFLSEPGDEPPKLGLQVGTLTAVGGPRRLHQNPAEIAVAAARAAG